ncbi:MAG TPA: ATP-binding protein [Acidimicrobiia bacterium]
MRDRTLVVALRASAGVGSALTLVASTALVTGGYAEAWLVGFSVQFFVVALCFAVVVWIVAPRQPRNPVVWTMAVPALCFGVWVAGKAAAAIFFPEGWAQANELELPVLEVAPAELPAGAAWLHFMTGWAAYPALLVPITLGLLLFPDGTLSSARRRPVAWLGVASIVTVIGAGLWEYRPSAPIPPEDGLVLSLGFLLGLVVAALSLADLVGRLRRTSGATRQQIKWVLWGTTAYAVAIGMGFVTGRTDVEYLLHVALTIAAVALPISYGIALGRYRLYDIDLVINRTLVYGSLAIFITAVYSLVVAVVGGLLGGASIWWSISATAIVAVAFEPVRAAVQRRVNRLIYGSRSTPYEVLGELTRRLGSAEGTTGLIERMAEQLAAGTGAERAVVWLDHDGTLRPAAVAPAAAEPPEAAEGFVADITLDGVRHGALSVEKRRGDPLTRQEQRLTSALAAAAAPVLHRVSLNSALVAKADELARSRTRLVDAQAVEQRRLRRALDEGIRASVDGLRSHLAALGAQADSEHSSAAGQLITGVASDAVAAIEQIDALARGIYPPVLEADGLTLALSALAAAVPIEVETTVDDLDHVDRAVAAGVYFTVSEALTNAAKHASGPVRLAVASEAGRIALTVEDAGPGFDPTAVDLGAGLANMTERVRLLGGRLTIDSAPGRGTVVAASVPIGSPRPAPVS